MHPPKSVIICGGGIVGLCCAYYLAREGIAVTLLEREAEDHDHCALGSAGYISRSHIIPLSAPGMVWQGLKWMMNSRSPFYIKPRLDGDLLRWSWLFWRACHQRHLHRAAPILRDLCFGGGRLFEELDDLTGNTFGLQKQGLLHLCKTQKSLDHEAHEHARIAIELGVEAHVLDARQTAALEPGTRLDIAGSIYFPADAHLTPGHFARALTELLKKMGVCLQWNTSVVGWRAASGRIVAVQTTAGYQSADEFVLAGGSWSPAMLTGLSLQLPMQAGKGYSLTLPNPRCKLAKSIMLTERRIAVTPMGAALRFGGTMELSGINHEVRAERVQQIIESVPHYFPEFGAQDFAGIKPWHGLRPVSPDGLPYIGRFGRYGNLAAACGHAMLGLTMAPITGLLIAEILGGRKPSVALEMLDPDRYA
ncbi:MAG: FAD-dependent oxidoreductase [Opitutaceae bacterium]|nr:FAD-dependent oxidoreductase [Opitutaceae bacterium]